MAAAKSKKAKKSSVKAPVKKVTKKAVANKSTKAKTKKSTAKNAAVRTTAPKKAVKSELVLKDGPVVEKQTQAQIISDLADATMLDKKAVRNVLEALRNQIQRHLKNRGSGEITLPSLGIKVRRVSKKATKSRQGVNPFTGEAMTIKAKPARKSARATALKALKDLV